LPTALQRNKSRRRGWGPAAAFQKGGRDTQPGASVAASSEEKVSGRGQPARASTGVLINQHRIVDYGSMEKGRKHHYIPVFYLTQWCGPDGRLCEYSRPRNKTIAQPKYPKETGFERGLYTLKAHTSAVAEIVEDKLMGRTDNDAARAHQLLLDNNIDGLDEVTRSAWARFLISLLRRTPESLRGLGQRLTATIIEQYPELGIVGDPEKDERAMACLGVFERQLAMLLQALLNSDLIGNHLINMRWNVVSFNSGEGPLLTSDRPFVVSNGMVGPNGHWVVPISPSQCFVATNSDDVLRELQALAAEEFIFFE